MGSKNHAARGCTMLDALFARMTRRLRMLVLDWAFARNERIAMRSAARAARYAAISKERQKTADAIGRRIAREF